MQTFIRSLPDLLCSSAPSRIDEDLELISFAFLTQLPASLSFQDYVQKLYKETACGPEPLVVAVYWIQKLAKSRPLFDISEWTIHRLFLTALVVAIKYCNDFYWNNCEYAQIGGIPLYQLNRLELLFAHDLMNWQLWIDQEHCAEYRELYLKAVLG